MSTSSSSSGDQANASQESSTPSVKNFSLSNPMVIDGVYYIPSEALLPEIQKTVLKHEEVFAVLDLRGESPMVYDRELGFYFRDTRYVDMLELSINGDALIYLSGQALAHGRAHLITMTNKDMVSLDSNERLPRDQLMFNRALILDRQQVIELVEIKNFDKNPHVINVQRRAGSQFSDIFEVRGFHRLKRGQLLPASVLAETRARYGSDLACLAYEGLDGRLYRSYFWVDGPTVEWQVDGRYLQLVQRIALPPQASVTLRMVISFDAEPVISIHGHRLTELSFFDCLDILSGHEDHVDLSLPDVVSDNQIVNRAFNQSKSDIYSLLTPRDRQESLFYPDAGIPWFCAPFGRDGLITAYQLLPWQPEVARGVLSYAFRIQGTKYDTFTDEEPGKIFHEMRQGEMARTREIPFIPYYGSIDSTPLCLVLLGEYVLWTGDIAFLRAYWEHALQALHFITERLGHDPLGLLTYQRGAETGLQNQGWKDSFDSVMHADGSLAQTPIALCEVQGYAYHALRNMAFLAHYLGDNDACQQWNMQAEALGARFYEHFWNEEHGYVHLAVDGAGQPCRVMASNQGHCLWSGILRMRDAERVAEKLLSADMFSGFGVRTLSRREKAYNPLSYHNGSIWPHDNSLIAMGLKRYQQDEALIKLATGMLRVLENVGDYRLPELYCGFEKHRGGGGPIPYAVACKPQAWAAGSLFLLLRALLGIEPHGMDGLGFTHPILPRQLSSVTIQGMRLGKHSADFIVRQGIHRSTLEILGKTEGFEIAVVA